MNIYFMSGMYIIYTLYIITEQYITRLVCVQLVLNLDDTKRRLGNRQVNRAVQLVQPASKPLKLNLGKLSSQPAKSRHLNSEPTLEKSNKHTDNPRY